MEKSFKSGWCMMVKFCFKYIMIVGVFCRTSFAADPHQTQNEYPALRLCLSVCDERRMKELPQVDKNNPYELIFDHFIKNTKINKQDITSIKLPYWS